MNTKISIVLLSVMISFTLRSADTKGGNVVGEYVEAETCATLSRSTLTHFMAPSSQDKYHRRAVALFRHICHQAIVSDPSRNFSITYVSPLSPHAQEAMDHSFVKGNLIETRESSADDDENAPTSDH